MLEVNRSVSNVRVGWVALKDRPVLLRFSSVAQGSIFRTEDSSNISVSMSYLDEMICCAEQQYTEEQQCNYGLIKSLHDGGMRYRKIADYLNEQGIKTLRGNN